MKKKLLMIGLLSLTLTACSSVEISEYDDDTAELEEKEDEEIVDKEIEDIDNSEDAEGTEAADESESRKKSVADELEVTEDDEDLSDTDDRDSEDELSEENDDEDVDDEEITNPDYEAFLNSEEAASYGSKDYYLEELATEDAPQFRICDVTDDGIDDLCIRGDKGLCVIRDTADGYEIIHLDASYETPVDNDDMSGLLYCRSGQAPENVVYQILQYDSDNESWDAVEEYSWYDMNEDSKIDEEDEFDGINDSITMDEYKDNADTISHLIYTENQKWDAVLTVIQEDECSVTINDITYSIGMTYDELEEQYNDLGMSLEDLIKDNYEDDAEKLLYHIDDYNAFTMKGRDNPVICYIDINRPGYATLENIALGSSVDELLSAYGDDYEDRSDKGPYIYTTGDYMLIFTVWDDEVTGWCLEPAY